MEYLLGVLVSIIVQVYKKLLKTSTVGTYFALLVVSVLGAGVYYYLSFTEYWPTVVKVLTIAAAFHNLVIRQVQKV